MNTNEYQRIRDYRWRMLKRARRQAMLKDLVPTWPEFVIGTILALITIAYFVG